MPTSTATDRASAAPSVPAHKDAAYLRYLLGQGLSGLGDQVWYVALAWAAVQCGALEVGSVLCLLAPEFRTAENPS